jgi:DNA-binding MarR family transcriptional regulator
MGEGSNGENSNNAQARGEALGDEKSLMEMFHRMAALMRRYPRQRPHSRDAQGDPHRGQGRVLSILKIKPDISQKDLGYLLDMRSQSLSELLIKLERAGYVTRAPLEEDHRTMNIHLTELGAAAAGQAEKHQADSGRLFDCLNAEEQANLSGYLKRLIARMTADLSAPREPGGTGYDYDPFWGVGQFKDGKHCCHPHRHDAKECRHALHGHIRAHSRQMRQEMREHGRAIRDEMRRDPRLREFFWGKEDWRDGPDDCDGAASSAQEDHGNGPRPQ